MNNKSLKTFFILTLLITFLLLIYSPFTYASEIAQEYIKIPAKIDGSIYNLEAMLYKPSDDGVYPLILINHGRSSESEKRKSPDLVKSYKRQAENLAQKGFTVVVAVRRGYGNSEGSDSEYSTASTIYQAGLEGAKDVVAVITFMQNQPYVDKQHVILIGQSCGGLVTVASTTKNIPGLVGAVNFAGGLRHTDNRTGGWSLGDESYLINTYTSYGRMSKVPMIWIYTENDSYFPSTLSPRMFEAFIKGGGTAKFYLLPPYGKDGHTFFPSKSNIPTWMPLFDDFLDKLSIPYNHS